MKHILRKSFLPILTVIVLLVQSSCNKTTSDIALPVVSTTDYVIDAATKSIYIGGIAATDSYGVTAYGICYSTANTEPTINDTNLAATIDGFSFISNVTGLTAGTKYYLRAYATNSTGTGYGSVVTITLPANLSENYGVVSTLSGNAEGFSNGMGTAALFYGPMGSAVNASGNIYVTDSFNSAIREVTPGGLVTTLTGTGNVGYLDGTLSVAQFYAPSGIAVDAQNNVYVADRGNNLIRKITAAGVVSTFAGGGSAGLTNGTSTAASFNTPTALATDAAGNVYVADKGNNAIRKITPEGVVTTFAGSTTKGYVNDTGTSALFDRPSGIALDAAGNVYVADFGNNAIRKITPAGVVTTYAGDQGSDLVGAPTALAIDKDGTLFIADGNGRVLSITAAKVLHVLAGTSGTSGLVNGAGKNALFSNPQGVAVDASGNIYVSDYNNNQIRKIVMGQ